MDPFTEKDLIENLKSIATSLRNIDTKMDDMTMSLRELAASQLEGEDIDEVADKTEEIV